MIIFSNSGFIRCISLGLGCFNSALTLKKMKKESRFSFKLDRLEVDTLAGFKKTSESKSEISLVLHFEWQFKDRGTGIFLVCLWSYT